MAQSDDEWRSHWRHLMEDQGQESAPPESVPEEKPTRPAASNGQGPDRPTDLDKGALKTVLKRTVKEFKEDELTDRAAALTYYSVLSIFPALLALVSVLGLLGDSVTNRILENLSEITPGPARDFFTGAVENLQRSKGVGGVLFVIGLAGALWSASGYVAAFMRASNAIYDVEEGRPFVRKAAERLAVTIVLGVLLAVSALAVVLTGGLAERVGDLLGLGDTAVRAWDIAKWPVLLVVVSLMFAVLYWASPNVKQPGFRWISPGGLLAVVIWIAASGAFAFYVANFGSYNKTYGTLGGVIIFLVWLWLSNVAVLLGAEFNAELEREKAIEGGMRPRDKEPFLEPRDTRKLSH